MLLAMSQHYRKRFVHAGKATLHGCVCVCMCVCDAQHFAIPQSAFAVLNYHSTALSAQQQNSVTPPPARACVRAWTQSG